jgi:hypothetical protein
MLLVLPFLASRSLHMTKDTKTNLGHKGATRGTTSGQAQRPDVSQRWYPFVIFVTFCANVPCCSRARADESAGTAIREALAFLVCHPAIQVWQEYGQETDQRQERADTHSETREPESQHRTRRTCADNQDLIIGRRRSRHRFTGPNCAA